MSDLISRQAAIDALGEEPFAFIDYEQGLHDKWVDDKEAIEQLSSAQPDVSGTDVGDMISRQEAIDGVKTLHEVAWKNWHEPTLSANVVIDMIKDLPSAQSEIIRCGDCKHRGEKPIADGRYWCEIHDTFMYYCSDAERRTDE